MGLDMGSAARQMVLLASGLGQQGLSMGGQEQANTPPAPEGGASQVCSVDAQGRVEAVSAELASWCGSEPAAWLGRELAPLLLPYVSPGAAEELQALLADAAQGRAGRLTTSLNGAHKSRLCLTTTPKPLTGGYLLLAEDLAELLELRSLKLGWGQVEQVLESTTDAVVVLNREWRYTYLNRRAVEMIAANRGDMVGRNMWEEFPEALHMAAGVEFLRTMNERVVREFEFFYPAPLNLWLEVHCYPATGGIVMFFRDNTEQRRNDLMLQLQRQAMEAVPVGITITQTAEQGGESLVYANPAFLRISGYEEAELLGRDLSFLQAHDREQPAATQLRSAVAEGRAETVMLRNYRKNGTQWINELQVSPVRDDHGRVTHHVGIQNDVTQRVRMREHLIRQAQYDALTELPNRHRFLRRLQQALEESQSGGRTLAVVYIDVDNLKQVNDTMGHASGDKLLRVVAQRLAAVVRSEDTMARLGGDEFAVFIAGYPDRTQLEALIQRLVASVAAPLELGTREVQPSISAGYAVCPEDSDNPEELLRMADLAMYTAKRESKNTWSAYVPALDSNVKQNRELADALRWAVERQEFELFYQPRVQASTGRVSSLEALVRWRHPERGLLLPVHFIPFAEQTGIIREIGHWVITEAARQSVAWRAEGRRSVPISVNVSPAQIRRPDFPNAVVQVLRETGLEPSMLELELTESLLVDSSFATDALLSLRASGLRIAIDDFGTGYSALNYLARLPVDTLKVDRSFIQPITTSDASAAICRYILQLGEVLRLTTVAEGVETAAEAELLRGWGCHELQGFFFSRPVPGREVERMLD